MWVAVGCAGAITMDVNDAAGQVMAPRLDPRAELHRAIALQGLQFKLARVVGPALAGLLLAQTSATVLFALNTLSFVGVILAIRSTEPAPPPPGPAPAARAQILEARRFMFGDPGPRTLFFMLVLLSALAAPLQRMLPLFVSEVFRAGETSYGLLLGLFGAGAVLGGLTLGRWPTWYPRHHLIPLSLTLTGACMTLFCATRSLPLASVWIFLAGLSWIWAFSSMITALQLRVSDVMRGRALAVANMAMFGAMPVGSLLAAVLGSRLAACFAAETAAAVQLGVGAGTLLLTVLGLLLLICRTPQIDEEGPANPPPIRSLWHGVTAKTHRPSAPS